LQEQHIDFENSVFGKTTNPGLSAIKRHFYWKEGFKFWSKMDQ
jgi:hypothetical protein